MWDAETGKPIGEALKGHEAGSTSAAFSPDGKPHRHRVWGQDGRLWDARDRQAAQRPLKAISRGVQPRRQAHRHRVWDKTARMWDAATGKPIGEPLKGHEGDVNSAAFSPDGKRIVTASEDKTARMWDAATGKPIGEPLKGHSARGL